MCATMRLFLLDGERPTTPLAQRIFADEGGVTAIRDPRTLPIKYSASLPSSGVHKDTNPPTRLTDGLFEKAETQSVQYDGDVTITAELPSAQFVEEARIVLFTRGGGDFNPQSVIFQSGQDKQTWKTIGEKTCSDFSGTSVTLSSPIGESVRYVQFQVKRAEGAKRILVGEIMLLGKLVAVAPDTRPAEARFNTRPVRPMHVKKTLDDALLAAKVQYLYSCYATDVLRDEKGNLCGIVMANRAGRQAILAKVIIDATDRAWVAHGRRNFRGPAGRCADGAVDNHRRSGTQWR